jgi:hypothetical protein
MRLLASLLFLLAFFAHASALKFFLYNPKVSKSTIGLMNKVGDILTEAGHDVVSYFMFEFS